MPHSASPSKPSQHLLHTFPMENIIFTIPLTRELAMAITCTVPQTSSHSSNHASHSHSHHPDNFDPVAQWLLTLYLAVPCSHINNDPTHEVEDPSPDDEYPPDNMFNFADCNSNDNEILTPLPDTLHQHPLSIVWPIIQSQSSTTSMVISIIYTQNAHGHW